MYFFNQSDDRSDMVPKEPELASRQDEFFADWHPIGSPELSNNQGRQRIEEEYFG